MNTPKEISQLLANQAEAVAKYLLPNGKKDGTEWRCGDVSGSAGKSMGVCISGTKAGVWADFATGEGGDLLDLWRSVNGCDLVTALKAAKQWLGIEDKPQFAGNQRKNYDKPKKVPGPIKSGSIVEPYLISRGLSVETIAVFRVGEHGKSALFPCYKPDGELAMVKWRDTTDKKCGVTEKNMEPTLFGWQAIPSDARWVAITEGEIDAMSLYEYGIPALSVPFGGGAGAKQEWITTEYDNLNRFDAIFLAMDQDEMGRKAVAEIVDRLGRHRCRVVELPHKDANDCLKAGVTVSVMMEIFTNARTLDPTELKPAGDYVDDVLAAFYPAENERGFSTPWAGASALKFRPGETTMIAGVNGHGKSEMCGHLALEAMAQGIKVCVASMEFKPGRWLQRLTRQAAGLAEPSEGYIRKIMSWFGQDRLWVFDVSTTAKHQRMLEVFEYARARYGVELFVIDNLSKLDIPMDDYEGQRKFVDRVTDFAKNHDVHVFVVAHVRKGEDDGKPTGKMDIKGSGALTDLVETVLICWRNRLKEAKLKNAQLDEHERAELEDKPDAMCICEKQRNGEDEPRTALWFDRQSHQYLEFKSQKPREYVPMRNGA